MVTTELEGWGGGVLKALLALLPFFIHPYFFVSGHDAKVDLLVRLITSLRGGQHSELAGDCAR